ncbi:MAG: DUF3656 domain-containing protein, partial [Eubacterium sp.]|nr:DUF3656 domain-containing protein [Eubacterium sp.]
RMKRAEYSAYMAYLYRHYVDVYREEGADYYRELVDNPESVLWQDYRRSMDLYNRGGFSKSYLFEKKKSNMLYEKKNGHFGVPVGEVISCEKKSGKVSAAIFLTKEEINSQDVLEFRNEKEESVYEYTAKYSEKKGRRVRAKVLPGSHIYPGQTVYRTKNVTLLKNISSMIESSDDRIGLYGKVTGEIGKPLRLEIEAQGTKIVVLGDEVQKAAKRPVEKEDIRKRLDSLGNTKYKWEQLSVSIEEEAFLPLGGLKELRRRAITSFEKEAVEHRKLSQERIFSSGNLRTKEEKQVTDADIWQEKNIISIARMEQLKAALQTAKKNTIFHLKLEDIPPEKWQESAVLLAEREYALSFPRILRGMGKTTWEKDWEIYGRAFLNHLPELLIINSHAMYLEAKKWLPGIPMAAEENLYRKNHRAKEVYRRMGMTELPACCYGRIPVMVTEGCVPGCCTPEKQQVPLLTPKKDKFIVVKHCHYCYNTIYTEQPEREKIKAPYRRMNFTLESAGEVRKEIKEWNF